LVIVIVRMVVKAEVLRVMCMYGESADVTHHVGSIGTVYE